MNENISGQPYDIYFKSVSRKAENRYELALWSSWGTGAAYIDRGLPKIKGYELIPDNPERIKQLVNLLIQPMISFWYYDLEKQEAHTGDEILGARQTAFENIQGFLDLSSPDALNIHLILDAELTYCLNALRESSAYYIGMFHQRYRECAIGEQIVDWKNLKVPIDTWDDFQSNCDNDRYEYLDVESKLATFALISNAGARMFQEFKKIYQQKD